MVAMTIALGSALALFLGVNHVRAGTLSLGNLLVVMAYLAQLYKLLETSAKKVGTLQAGFASAERVFRVLDELPDVPEKKLPRPLRSMTGAIAFRNVQTRFRQGRKPFRIVRVCLVNMIDAIAARSLVANQPRPETGELD